jgi:hypothetical protein
MGALPLGQTPVFLYPPHNPGDMRRDRFIERPLDYILLEQLEDLAMSEIAVTRDMDMLHALCSALIGEPPRGNADKACDLLDGVRNLGHCRALGSYPRHHCGISNAGVKELLKVADTQLLGKIEDRRARHKITVSTFTLFTRQGATPTLQRLTYANSCW